MKNGLVAEQRLDKNGKTVTRWVKPDDSSGPSLNLPAPSSPVGPQKDYLAMRQDIAQRFYEERLDISENPLPFLLEASDQTIDLIHETCEKSKTDSEGLAEWELSRLASTGIAENIFVEYVHLYQYHKELHDSEISVYMIKGLHASERNRSPMDLDDPESIARNTALLQCMVEISLSRNESAAEELIAFGNLKQDGHLAHYFADERITDILCDHPERVHELVDTITERGAEGVDLFVDALRQPSYSLMRGRL